MPLTKISSSEIQTGAVTADKIATNVSLGGPKITTVNVANSAYTVLDDTAVNIGGGYIVITGSGFESGAQVIIDTTTATSVSYVNNTTLRAEVPSKSAASYNLYVVNPDGGTAIRVNGLTYSANPTWVTASPLANWSVDVAANVAFSATGATSYSNTTALPAGTQLLSNGYFYGTVTGISVETQYTFTVRATDAENQESDKSFSVTVTVGPPPGGLYSWGLDDGGAISLGLNQGTTKSSPTQIGSLTSWIDVIPTIYGGFALKSDNTLWAWGHNADGQLGTNDTISRSSPTQIGSLTNWSIISGSTYLTSAIKKDGTLWSWGKGFYGGLPLNSTTNRSSPVQVGSSTNWSKVTMGSNIGAAITTDGKLYVWGDNSAGRLGLGSPSPDPQAASSPVQVGSDTNWSDVKAANNLFSFLALKTNGTLWSWGQTVSSGILGLNSTNNVSSPTQIGSGTNWSQIFNRKSTLTFAKKNDNTLWGWGDNDNGGLGNNNNTSTSSPVQIGNANDWAYVSGGNAHSLFRKSNGTLWAVGNAGAGKLGLADINRSSPVQVGSSTNWITVEAGSYQSYGISS